MLSIRTKSPDFIGRICDCVSFLQCTDKLERDRLILFLNKLINNKVKVGHKKVLHFCKHLSWETKPDFSRLISLLQRNVKDIMDANGIRCLVDLLTLAHLHTSRATVPTQVSVNFM